MCHGSCPVLQASPFGLIEVVKYATGCFARPAEPARQFGSHVPPLGRIIRLSFSILSLVSTEMPGCRPRWISR